MSDYPFSSVLLGGELLKILLGRACGFADVVSNFCETSPTDTAEGRVKKECSSFPLPLPSNSDLEQMRAAGAPPLRQHASSEFLELVLLAA